MRYSGLAAAVALCLAIPAMVARAQAPAPLLGTWRSADGNELTIGKDALSYRNPRIAGVGGSEEKILFLIGGDSKEPMLLDRGTLLLDGEVYFRVVGKQSQARDNWKPLTELVGEVGKKLAQNELDAGFRAKLKDGGLTLLEIFDAAKVSVPEQMRASLQSSTDTSPIDPDAFVAVYRAQQH